MDPIIGAALISGAANLGGGFMSAQGQSSANAQNLAQANMINQQMLSAQMAQHAQNTAFMEDAQAHQMESQSQAQMFNAAEAAKQRQWTNEMFDRQTGLANSAYQRAMADMRKAGLNPILAYKMGGAGAPMGGSGAAASGAGGSAGMATAAGAPSLRAANILNDKEQIGRALGNAVSSAVDVMKTGQGIEVMKADKSLKDEQTRRVGYETANIDAQTGKTLADTNVSKQEERNKQIEELILKANTITAAQNARIASADAEASERYGGKYAPNSIERILRAIQDATERGGPAGSAWDRTGVGFGNFRFGGPR